MSKKPKYQVTLPDGTIATRDTKRTYTHAVAARRTPAEIAGTVAQRILGAEKTVAYYEAKIAAEGGAALDYDGQTYDEALADAQARLAERKAEQAALTGEHGPWFAYGFCGRYDLALKEAAKLTSGRFVGCYEVEIVEAKEA